MFPGRVTDNMVCAGGEAGKDACQVNQLRVMVTTGDRKEVMEEGRKTNGFGGGGLKRDTEADWRWSVEFLVEFLMP